MQIDQTTLSDLSIFNVDEEQSVFHKLNHTQTDAGKFWLKQFFSRPFDDLEKIEQTQQLLQLILNHQHQWPTIITNGTIMVLEKFYDTAIDDMPKHPDIVSAISYKLIHGPDYGIVKYTVGHCIDFVKGLQQNVELFSHDAVPPMLHAVTGRIALLLQKDAIQDMLAVANKEELSKAHMLRFGYFIRNQFKQQLFELIDLHGKLDAWCAMATAVKIHNLHFPTFSRKDEPMVKARQLFHILLPVPIAYDLQMDQRTNFIFLTGANMAGKSTFIKAVGVSVYLAHLGMGVPAEEMQLSLFHGLLSNIQVNDNIIKGESYFFNEVQRIKNTIIKINNGKKWLVLIDELFKGTNVQDAMKCSSAVIQGLVKMHRSLFILSTHLYEIGEDLKTYPNITFRYFETAVLDDQLDFSYQLKEGISNDRIGYLILRREKVVELLEGL
ncbi:MAG: DNA mismatch repair protein MutS [Chitinophagaceae bacterium]